MPFQLRVFPPLLALTVGALFAVSSSSAAERFEAACESPERCYEAALKPMPAAAAVTPDDRRHTTLSRLEILRQRFPESIWAKRAGVLTGLLMTEHDPGRAARLFEAAHRNLPVLDDYLRLWRAEALLRAGEARQAAALSDSIPQSVPDTLLGSRAAFLTGAAWYKAGDCKQATEVLTRAVRQDPREQTAPAALLDVAECHLRQKQKAKAKSVFKEIWVRYPNSPEAREAETRMARFKILKWKPTSEDFYERANALLLLAYHEEAVVTIKKFLSRASKKDSRREDMRFRLGTTLVLLKRYEEARGVFLRLADGRGAKSGEATVWLARIYVAQEDGKQLLALSLSLPKRALSADQKAAIQALVASHHDNQSRDGEAIATYRHVAQTAENPTQRSDALWQIGWIHYRNGRFREAVEAFEQIMDDPQFAPQALYWTARALDRLQDLKAPDHYLRLCQRYAFSYQCQLAQSRTHGSGLIPIAGQGREPDVAVSTRGISAVTRNVHYRRAVELKLVGMDHEAARELTWLAEHYARDREALVELSSLLGEAGAQSHAFRLVKLHFTESLEQGADPVPKALWDAAYPTTYLPVIRAHAGTIVDPYLVLAIIREESHYDTRALSQHGAVGLMQLMPATVQALAKQHGHPEVRREELFDHDTNIRFGVRYLEQLLQQFLGNVVHTVAAYNAGPNAVNGWIAKNNGKEPDEFIEAIPYQETRQYVKKVLRSYHEYHRLGGTGCDPRFLDKVC